MKLPKYLNSREIMIYFSLLAGSVTFMLVVFIFPSQQALLKQESAITKVKAQLESHEKLQPLFFTLLKRSKFKPPPDLTIPVEKKLPREDLEQLLNILTIAADKNELELLEVLPQVNAMLGGSELLSVDLSLQGALFSFRNYLIKLSEIPYLDHIERIKLRKGEAGHTFNLRLCLSVE